MNVNKVIIVGRLTRDPELRTTPNGQTVATLGIATSSYWNDKGGQRQEKTEFHNVVLWGRTAEIAGQYLTKGQLAFVEGRLQSRSYTGKDGVERKIVEIVGETLQLGSKPQGAGSSQGNSNYRPQQAAQPQARPQAAPVKEEEIPTINLDEEAEEIKLEDVPF